VQSRHTNAVVRVGLIVIGVNDLRRAAVFWQEALGYRARAAHASDRWLELEPTDGIGGPIALHVSETPVQPYPRIHLDLDVDSPEAQAEEATRLEVLGAKPVHWDRWPDDPDFIVMEDTEGNRFCIVDTSHP
jgi:catechol 2,3-dioxygenase-like lactoylglutathione lyase family enzyme